MGTISSTNIESRAVSGTISLTHPSLPDGDTFEVSDIGTISSEYDLEDDSSNADDVYFNLGEFKFTAFDKLSDGSSLFNVIDNNLLSTDEIVVTLSLTVRSTSRSFVDLFIVTKNDIEYKYLGRSVRFECKDQFDYSDTIQDIFDNNAGDIETLRVDSGTMPCMSINDFILNTLDVINPNNTNINESFSFPDDQQSGGEAWVVNEFTGATGNKATELLYKLGAFDGSIIGSMLGYNFFSNRLVDSNITLSEDDVESIEVSTGLDNYKSIKSIFKGVTAGTSNSRTWASVAAKVGTADNLNDNATKTLNVYFAIGFQQGESIAIATWNPSTSEYDINGQPLWYTMTNIQTVGETSAGDTEVDIDDGSGGSAPLDLSSGDIIYFNASEDLSYKVDSQTSGTIFLTEPLIEDVPNDADVFIWKELGNRNSVSEKAADCYAHAYGGNGARTATITIFGIDNLLPYQSFTLDSSFRDSISGLTFRPSKIEYDLTADKVIIKEAYQIG